MSVTIASWGTAMNVECICVVAQEYKPWLICVRGHGRLNLKIGLRCIQWRRDELPPSRRNVGMDIS